MDISIPLGSWLIPVMITLGAFGLAIAKQDNRPTGDYGAIGQGIGNAILHGMALVVTLIAWLIWALVA